MPIEQQDEKLHNINTAPELIGQKILLIRGIKVMLDSDLAVLYQVPTKSLNLAVRRNIKRFPRDFMFRLDKFEMKDLRFQFETSKKRGGRRYVPYAFTELGVSMLSSVLKSDGAVQMNIHIMRAFVALRQMLASNSGLARKIMELEKEQKEHHKHLIAISTAVNRLIEANVPKSNAIGFRVGDD